MLLEFNVRNFRSIKDEVSLSMVASCDDSFDDKLIQSNGFRILRSSAIYGANGSGKTNILKALSLMKNMITGSVSLQLGDALPYVPHKLSVGQPTVFSIQFMIDGIRYAYGFSYNENEILSEYLFYFVEGGRQRKVFEYNYGKIEYNTKYNKAFETPISVKLPNRLFLSCCANFSQVEEIKRVFLFFKEKFISYSAMLPNNWLNYSIKTLQENQAIKDSFLSLMNGLGSDIKDFTARMNRISCSDATLPPALPEELRGLLNGKEIEEPIVKLNYELFNIDLREESAGVQKLFEILCPLIDIIKTGKILLCDEIENSLHEFIVHEIINLINNNKSSNAQLIYTTHNTNLLDTNFTRRDQIWFTELEKTNRSTKLYSLWDIKNVRKGENFQKGYFMGRYGAIPILNHDLYESLNWETE